MAEVKTILRTNTDYNASMTVDGAVAVTMHGSINTANPGNYNFNRNVQNESLYESVKSEIDKLCEEFEEMVKAAANTENDGETTTTSLNANQVLVDKEAEQIDA